MLTKLVNLGVAVSIACVGATAIPAAAHPYGYDRAGYQRYDRDDGDEGGYDREGDADRSRYERRRHYQEQYRRFDHRQCHAGTTGAIIGGVLGGLLGREIGRGGYYNEPSTTGLLIGAGGGALAGRAIERNQKCR